jgi:hypothetical protein
MGTMTEPNPTVKAALKQANEAIAALRKAPTKSVSAARAKAAEQIRLQKESADFERRMTDANAQTRITNGNGHASDVLSDELMTALAHALVPFLKETIAKALAPVFDRIIELEARVIELRQQPSPKYRGVWDAQTGYFPGEFVSDHGSVWHCERACTSVRPGSDLQVWKLAIPRGKRGRDARDGR